MHKKGVSAVIATVLLILISIIAVSIIAGVIIPFIKNNLGPSTNCLDLIEVVHIDPDSGYTCLNSNTSESSITIEVGNVEIDKFIVSLSKAGTADSYVLEDNKVIENVRMYGEQYGALIKLPPKNGARTYVFNQAAERVKIIPVVGEKTCEFGDYVQLSKCT